MSVCPPLRSLDQAVTTGSACSSNNTPTRAGRASNRSRNAIRTARCRTERRRTRRGNGDGGCATSAVNLHAADRRDEGQRDEAQRDGGLRDGGLRDVDRLCLVRLCVVRNGSGLRGVDRLCVVRRHPCGAVPESPLTQAAQSAGSDPNGSQQPVRMARSLVRVRTRRERQRAVCLAFASLPNGTRQWLNTKNVANVPAAGGDYSCCEPY